MRTELKEWQRQQREGEWRGETKEDFGEHEKRGRERDERGMRGNVKGGEMLEFLSEHNHLCLQYYCLSCRGLRSDLQQSNPPLAVAIIRQAHLFLGNKCLSCGRLIFQPVPQPVLAFPQKGDLFMSFSVFSLHTMITFNLLFNICQHTPSLVLHCSR